MVNLLIVSPYTDGQENDKDAAPQANVATTEKTPTDGETEGTEPDVKNKDEAPAKILGPPTQYQYTQAKQQVLIANEIQSGETIWLTALNEPFLATWYIEHSGKPKGAALIIPSSNTNPSQQEEVANLLHYLSANGWAALAISMPQQHPTRPPAVAALIPATTSSAAEKPTKDSEPTKNENNTTDTTNPKNTEPESTPAKESEPQESPQENDNTPNNEKPTQIANQVENREGKQLSSSSAAPYTPPPPTEPIALARISAAVNYLQEQSQFNNVIIAEGIGVARAVYFLQSLETEPTLISKAPEGVIMQHPFRALIMINAEHHLKEQPTLDISTVLTTLPIPLLDIHTHAFERHSHKAIQQRAARKKALARSDIPIYITRTINDASVDQKGEHRLTRIIRGFLYQHAQGEETTR